ncbi:alkaline D-peptidase [Lophiostoma macrostomum CBS 122681]|uniref:Alkaline D-peptidase n=1 Tax=Lophiostoma macrostomum CBS 122681 TaxID=1314788 RepID=A0A6A6SUA8_9PLEO|nr:alkaline D-peptidase [Lophiostoma macrostomum CBS 122681]
MAVYNFAHPVFLTILLSTLTRAASFVPCPLLGPRFPILSSTSSSKIVQEGSKNLTDAFDAYLTKGDGVFNTITPNTTSFKLGKANLYEYHHNADSLANATKGVSNVDADSIYRIGDLTTLLTTFLFLVEAGESHWDEPISKWVPELRDIGFDNVIRSVQWDKITLGDLAAHLSGIGRHSPIQAIDTDVAILLANFGSVNDSTASSCGIGSSACDRAEFLSYIATRPPVFSSAATPVFSNAGFIILAYALETIKGRPFADLLQGSILGPLHMSNTSLLSAPIQNSVLPSTVLNTGFDDAISAEGPFNVHFSSVSDLSTALRAILSSQFLDQAVTNRWLKPVSQTSNLVNTVGRPWEIYSLTVSGNEPTIPIYQVRGNVGLYSSHVGLVPDYNVGFVMPAADSERNPDLNADIIATQMIPVLEENAIVQASAVFGGTYGSNSTASLTIAQATDSTTGLSVTTFTANGTDLRSIYAKLNRIKPENLSVRLYPTDLRQKIGGGEKIVFRAIFQGMSDIGDAGTPTCDTWRSIDALQVNERGVDEFVFEVVGVSSTRSKSFLHVQSAVTCSAMGKLSGAGK